MKSVKPNTPKDSSRLDGVSTPMSIYRKQTKLRVYLGHGWATGVVVHSDEDKCNILLTKEQRVVCCTDNRNLARVKDEKQVDWN